jgi:hypothetical protein
MSDPRTTTGSYAASSDDCDREQDRPVDLNWNTVIRFFGNALRDDNRLAGWGGCRPASRPRAARTIRTRRR